MTEPIWRAPITGSTWFARIERSCAFDESRFTGSEANHAAASMATVRREPFGSASDPAAFFVISPASNARASANFENVRLYGLPLGSRSLTS